jgi:hypothetical protein
MKFIIKLLVALVLVNAAARGGFAAVRYYQFKESAQQAVLFGATNSPADIRKRILARADELRLPVDPEDVAVGREGSRTWANASYTQSVEWFPNQKYPVDLSFEVEGFSMVLTQ